MKTVAYMLDRVAVDAQGCWLWQGFLNGKGYGSVSVTTGPAGSKTTRRAHRLMYELVVGPIPSGLHLDHLCRVRSCVNPDHLEPVTNAENARRGVEARTHCPHGHAYTPDNVGTSTKGRFCLTCKRQAAETVRRRKRLSGVPRGKGRSVLSDADPRHGKYTSYSNHSCRCALCTEAWRVYCIQQREQRAARKAAA